MSNIVRSFSDSGIIVELQNVLASVQAVDANTDTIEASLTSQITELQSLNATDFASEATLAAAKTVLDNALTQLQSILTEIQAVNANTDNVEALLQQIVDLIPIPGENANKSTVAQSTSSVQLAPVNTDRVEIIIKNNSQNKSHKLYLSFGSAAVVGDAIELAQGDIYIEDKYTGAIFGIWDSAGSGDARIMEVTTLSI